MTVVDGPVCGWVIGTIRVVKVAKNSGRSVVLSETKIGDLSEGVLGTRVGLFAIVRMRHDHSHGGVLKMTEGKRFEWRRRECENERMSGFERGMKIRERVWYGDAVVVLKGTVDVAASYEEHNGVGAGSRGGCSGVVEE